MPPDHLNAPGPLVADEHVGALEADQFHRMSAWAGHAGPNSSWPYINQIESPLSSLARLARPGAWVSALSEKAIGFFPDLSQDPDPDVSLDLDLGSTRPLAVTTRDVALTDRLNLTFDIADRKSYVVAAAACKMDAALALRVLLEVHHAMELSRLIRRKAHSSDAAISGIRGFASWVVAARAAKLVDLIEAISVRIDQGDGNALRPLFEAWRQARVCEHLSLDDGYVGAALVSQLRKLGVRKEALVIKSRNGAPALDRSVTAFGLRTVGMVSRQEKVQHRLQVIEPDANPEEAAGKQVSSVGLHWLMVLLASWLISAGDLTWS